MMTKPYKAVERRGYWIVTDLRTDEPASYPTTKRNAQSEATILNDAYAEAVMDEFRQNFGVDQLLAGEIS